MTSASRLGKTLARPTTSARKDKANVQKSNYSSLDNGVLIVDNDSYRRTRLRAAELRQLGWFMVR